MSNVLIPVRFRSHHQRRSHDLASPLFTIVMTLALALVSLSSLVAQDSQDQQRPTSLEIVPETASFYMASMNHAAQYDAFVQSNAYQKLMDCEVAKRMRKAYRKGRRNGFGQFGWNNPFAEYLGGYAESVGSVPGKMVINYLRDIFGNEVFVYGDQDWMDMSRAVSDFYKEAGVTMESMDPNNMDEETIRGLLQLGRKHMAGVNTPRLVMGTVLDAPGGTKSLLQMAELGIDEIMTQIPDEMDYVIDAYEVIERGDLYMLTFQVDSEMLPWEDLEGDPEFAPFMDDIKAILAGKTINVSLGVKGRYLLLSIGPDNQHVMNLGKGKRLVDLPRLKPLKDAAAQHPITTVNYVSEELARFNYESIPGMIDMVSQMIDVGIRAGMAEAGGQAEGLAGLSDDLKADAQELKQDLLEHLPKPGAYLGFSYMFEKGFEGYIYNWAENKYLDDSAPLTIVDYMGQNPAMFAASRDSGDQRQYEIARKWLARVVDRVLKYGPEMAPNDREAQMFRDLGGEVREILSTLADSTQSNLLEATGGSQSALIMDFTTAKDSWHDMMPESYIDLPIPSLAVVIEHDNSEKIVATGSSYLKATRDVVEMIRQIPGSDVPDEFQIQDPLTKSAFGGDLYFYEFPIQAGLDNSLAPHALIRDDLLLLGYSMDQTERLLQGKAPSLNGLLADRTQNAMSVAYYNNRELVNALHAWFKYGIRVAKDDGLEISLDQDVEDDTLAFQEPELMEALNHVLDLVKCFESCSSMSYMEDGVQVTRYQMLFEDIQDR